LTEQIRVRRRASWISVGVRTIGCGIGGVIRSLRSNGAYGRDGLVARRTVGSLVVAWTGAVEVVGAGAAMVSSGAVETAVGAVSKVGGGGVEVGCGVAGLFSISIGLSACV